MKIDKSIAVLLAEHNIKPLTNEIVSQNAKVSTPVNGLLQVVPQNKSFGTYYDGVYYGTDGLYGGAVRNNKQTESEFEVYERRNPDGTIQQRSTLYEKNASGLYQKRKLEIFSFGAVQDTLHYKITYDTDGDWTKEELIK